MKISASDGVERSEGSTARRPLHVVAEREWLRERRTCGRSHSIASENLIFVAARILESSGSPEAVRAAHASASARRELRLTQGGMSCSEHERHVEKTYAVRSEFA